MWNTAVRHGSENSPSKRIFFQIELEDDKSFNFYMQKHLEGKLLL